MAVAVGSGALLPVFLLSAAASSSTFVLANSVEHRHRRNDDNRNGNRQHGPAMHVLRGGYSMTRRQLKRKRLVAHSSAHHPSHIRHNENDAKVAAAAVADSEPTSRNDSSTRKRRHARTSAITIRQTREVDRDVDRSKHFRHSEKDDETKDSKSDSDGVQAAGPGVAAQASATLHFYHSTASAAASSTASANDRYYYDVGYESHDGQQAQFPFPMDQTLTADEYQYYLQRPDDYDLLNNRDADNDKQPMQQQAHLQFHIPQQPSEASDIATTDLEPTFEPSLEPTKAEPTMSISAVPTLYATTLLELDDKVGTLPLLDVKDEFATEEAGKYSSSRPSDNPSSSPAASPTASVISGASDVPSSRPSEGPTSVTLTAVASSPSSEPTATAPASASVISYSLSYEWVSYSYSLSYEWASHSYDVYSPTVAAGDKEVGRGEGDTAPKYESRYGHTYTSAATKDEGAESSSYAQSRRRRENRRNLRRRKNMTRRYN